MTLRDIFAASIKLDDSDWPSTIARVGTLIGRPRPRDDEVIEIQVWIADVEAKLRYIKADAMLRARKAGAE